MVCTTSIYGGGFPNRLTNDRYEQFQTGIKGIRLYYYQLSVDRKSLKFKSLRADMKVNGGGKINLTPAVSSVGLTAAQSICVTTSDLQVIAFSSRAVEAGSMRGYGTLQSLAATEMMIDELSEELDIDAIQLRKKNVLKQNEKHSIAIPVGLCLNEILEKVEVFDWWLNKSSYKKEKTA